MSMSELYLVAFLFLFLSIFIVYSFLDFYILFMIFNYYSIVFRLVERFIHEPFGSGDWVTTPHVIDDN